MAEAVVLRLGLRNEAGLVASQRLKFMAFASPGVAWHIEQQLGLC